MSCHYAQWSKTTFVVGLLQFLTSAIIIGWLISVYWGLLVVVQSFDLPYLGNQGASFQGGANQVQDVAKFLASQQPRSDQEQFSAPQNYGQQLNPNGMINMGGRPFGGGQPGLGGGPNRPGGGGFI